MATVVAIVPDLMLSSRVEGALTAAGHDVSRARQGGRGIEEADLERADLLVADLNEVEPEAIAGRGVPVLGFFAHRDVEIRRRAEEAGVELVVPRSRMVRELPDLAAGLIQSST